MYKVTEWSMGGQYEEEILTCETMEEVMRYLYSHLEKLYYSNEEEGIEVYGPEGKMSTLPWKEYAYMEYEEAE